MPVTEPNWSQRVLLDEAEDAVIILLPATVKQFSVAAFPGAGGNIAVEVSISSRVSLKAELEYEGEYEDGQWLAWVHGATVNTNALHQFTAPISALRLKANTAPGIVEILGNAPGA